VYCESSGVNCFWVRNDILESVLPVEISIVQNFLNPKYLFRKSKGKNNPSIDKKWHFVSC
jgi:hypothetical protein